MRELDVLRGALERASRRAAGLNPIGDNSTMASARSAELEGVIARLPIEVEDLTPLQNAAGTFFAMVGITRVGDSDPIV